MRPVAPPSDLRNSPNAVLRPLPLNAFTPTSAGSFWEPRLRQLRDVTLRQQHAQNERTGRIDHFRRASGRKEIDEFVGRFYDDSDVYKWLEACSYALGAGKPHGGAESAVGVRRTRDTALAPDAALDALVDSVVDEVAAAQQPDGYLNTYFTFERAGDRWDNLTRMHQLYCAGHLIQAGIAHHRATGKRALLNVAMRFADLICATFTPDNRNTDGHEEIELALVELYRHTGTRAYLDQALLFLEWRGRGLLDGSQTFQDHLPVRAQREIVGHAVRATYLATGMADACAEGTHNALWKAVQALWSSAFERKAYITGGLGARWQGESFGAEYELPNERAYAETCAAIGGFFWNWRMLLLTGDTRHADWMETALYNGILAGLSLDGTHYFYQNPLASDGSHRRQEWFSTACCPPNIARLLLALPGYVATRSAGGVQLHQYLPGELRVGGENAAIGRVHTEYPWDGAVRIEVTEAGPFADEATLSLRIPGWCAGAQLRVNGAVHHGPAAPGTYATLTRRWRSGDVVELDLPMPPRRVYAHPHVAACRGRVALARGPLVYCVEGADHADVDLRDVALPREARLEIGRAGGALDVLGSITTLHAAGRRTAPPHTTLYAHVPSSGSGDPVDVTAIPYYAWANRTAGRMDVWLKETVNGNDD